MIPSRNAFDLQPSSGRVQRRLKLRVVAADSGSAILNETFEPLKVVALCSIVSEPPYRNTSTQISDLLMSPANRPELVVGELRMCRRLLQSVSADVVHLDMTLGGVSVSQLSISELRNMSISLEARQRISRALPELRKLATEIEQTYKVEVLAIGKESLPVRIAELTAGAYSVIYGAAEAVKRKGTVLLGLPTLTTVAVGERHVTARSLQPGEENVVGFAEDSEAVTVKVSISEFNNPTVRGFKVLRIEPRET